MRAAARAEAARAAGLEVGLEVVEKVVVKVEAMAAAETAAAMEAAVAAEWAAASAAMARRPDGGGARIARVEAWTMACALYFSALQCLLCFRMLGVPLGGQVLWGCFSYAPLHSLRVTLLRPFARTTPSLSLSTSY